VWDRCRLCGPLGTESRRWTTPGLQACEMGRQVWGNICTSKLLQILLPARHSKAWQRPTQPADKAGSMPMSRLRPATAACNRK